jgi:hypothetical protein
LVQLAPIFAFRLVIVSFPVPRNLAREAAGALGGPDQKPLTLSLPPVTVLPDSEAVGTALDRIALRIVAAVVPGRVEA